MSSLARPIKRTRALNSHCLTKTVTTKRYNDLIFDVTCDAADYDSNGTAFLTDDTLFRICLTFESTIFYAARLGWVHSKAPVCSKPECSMLERSSYLQQRSCSRYRWITKCCKSTHSILKGSIFYRSTLGKV